MRVLPRDPEPLLLGAVRACIALALLTPLVTAPWTLWPFSVGKALYARVLVAVAFALWAVLALARPRWRPPPSALLMLLFAGLAAAVLSAWLGVGAEHGFWGTYARMRGIVNAAHWAAFAVVVASVVRTGADWRRLLNANLAVGLAVAVFAIVRFAAPETPLPFPFREGYWPRIGASTGNPLILGAYMQAVAVLATGFLVRSCCAPAAEAPPRAADRAARRREARGARKGAGPSGGSAGDGWGLRAFWAAAAACALVALSLTGALGALAGITAGFAAACAAYALFGRSRRSRRLGLAGFAALAAGSAGLVVALALGGEAADPAAEPGAGRQDGRPAFRGGNVMLERAGSAEWVGYTVGNRLRNWESGLAAFAERPLAGWGAGNYYVASARHISPPRGRAKVRDHAHNLLIEEAVEKGAAGLAAWLALWTLTGLTAMRAAQRIGDARERALAIFAGAALGGWLVQGLTFFYTAESWLQHMLLLAFLAHVEVRLRGGAPLLGRLAAPLRRLRIRAWAAGRAPAGARVAAGAAALALAGASIGSSAAIHAGAAAMWRADHGGPFLVEIERAIGAFGPLATEPRIVLFNNLALNWEVLARHQPEEAARLLAAADGHAAAALAADPESWVLHHALARLYVAVAADRPAYGTHAERHLERSRALAPNLDPMEAPLPAGRR